MKPMKQVLADREPGTHIVGLEWTEFWILLFPVESASPTFIQAPLPRPLSHPAFGIIVFYIAAGIQHIETEEIFEVLSCRTNKFPKIGGKLSTIWVVWMVLSQQKCREIWTMTSLTQLRHGLCIFYSLHRGINASKENPTISPYLQGKWVSTSTYRLLSSADLKSKLMLWNQWLCKWHPWEQGEWLKCCLRARQSWEPLPNSSDFFSRYIAKY